MPPSWPPIRVLQVWNAPKDKLAAADEGTDSKDWPTAVLDETPVRMGLADEIQPQRRAS